ncbi:MAG: bromoperoxidase, partial [Acidobacteriota bacterium]
SGDPADFQRTPLGPGEAAPVPDVPSVEKITPATADRRGAWESEEAKDLPLGPTARTGDLGARVRAWESAGAGNVFDLEGPDAQAVTMPPAPRYDSDELLAEIVEVYAMALLRDVPWNAYPLPLSAGERPTRTKHESKPDECANLEIKEALELLGSLDWFNADPATVSDAERSRLRTVAPDGSNLFRGVTPGEQVGPYLSQFLLLGNNSLEQRGTADPARPAASGFIGYGAIGIEQKVRVADPCKDYLTLWGTYIDAQNGADFRGRETYVDPEKAPPFRFIATPRDLATYVHYDALYEAYLNACLFLLTAGAPFDRGIPFLEADVFDKQQGFAHFGGPHILSLVTEVATRALKAVRYQKFNVHRRLRPETLGGQLDRWIQRPDLQARALRPLAPLAERFVDLQWGGESLAERVRRHNAENNEHFKHEPTAAADSYLLPMAFPEGSPMHPAYGAGHATVAGACVTILKAYFDHGWTPKELLDGTDAIAFEPSADGSELLTVHLHEPLTVEGELNKLAAICSPMRKDSM